MFLSVAIVASGMAIYFAALSHDHGIETSGGISSTQNIRTPSEDAIIGLLTPFIEKAINEHYGNQVVLDYMGQPSARQVALYNAQIDSIQRVTERPGNGHEFFYMIKVTVPTFHGAHNDPHALEEMMFRLVPSIGGIVPTLIHYQSIPNATITVDGLRKDLSK